MFRNGDLTCLQSGAVRGIFTQANSLGKLARFALGVTAVLFVPLLLSGCGGGDPLGRQAISGTVTLDGAPVQQGTISFDPESPEAVTSSGAVIVAGEYSIPRQAGLPPGKYRVRINVPKPGTDDSSEDNMTLPGEAGPVPVELAPPEWNSRSTQTIEVTPQGPFVFAFEI